MPPDHEFHGFFSYAHADEKVDPDLVEAFTTKLAARVSVKLVNASLSIWHDTKKLTLGDDWNNDIEVAIARACVLIVFVSPKWLESFYCLKEYSTFVAKPEIGTTSFVAPILVRNVEAQAKHLKPEQRQIFDGLGRVQYKKVLAADFLKLTSDQRAGVVEEVADEVLAIIERLRASLPIEPVSPKTPLPPPKRFTAASNIPIDVPLHFMGRDPALAAIAAGLQKADGRVAITALHGLRGVGKTTLAAAYARDHKAEYRATWWIRAQTGATMRADLVALGVQLGWVAADAKEEPALDVVKQRLRDDGGGLLLVYDNANSAAEVKPYLPRSDSAAHVIVTSTAPNWGGVAERVPIEVWSKTTGAAFLIAVTGRTTERAAAEALSETLGGLPLAHEQAAAYCDHVGVSLGDYSRKFAETPTKFLDNAEYASADYHAGLTVGKTFALAIEEAAKIHPAAEPLIVYAALLAPEPIPLYLFSEGREELGEPLASRLDDGGLDGAVTALRGFALIDRETIPDERDSTTTTDTIRLHRLVRQVAAGQCPTDVRDDMCRALIKALNSVYPDGVFNEPAAWPRARRLDALALAAIATTTGADTAASRLLDRLASYRQSALAAYSDARTLFERALAIREKVLGPEHPETATSLNNLALLLLAQGDLAGARPLFERALAINETALGPDHPDTATTLNNLAGLLRAQGDLAGARPLYKRALAIRETALGPDNPATATSLNNFALLLQAQGDLAGARPLYERALAIRETALGPDHPDTATSLDNLALLLLAQGDFAAARPLFERALAIREKVLSPDHPHTATSLNNFALLLQVQGDFAGAQPLFDRALAIREKALGPDHPDTATSLGNLAGLLQAQGDLAGARPLFERALAIYETALGPNHPDTATSLSNLAGLLQAQGDLAAARPLFERALAIREKALGPDHPDTATSLNNLASLLQAQGDLAGARPLCERALAICEKVLGPNHIHTQRCGSNYARLLIDTARPAKARRLGEAALAVHAAKLGPDHLWTKASARVTADAMAALGEAEAAAAVRARYGLDLPA